MPRKLSTSSSAREAGSSIEAQSIRQRRFSTKDAIHGRSYISFQPSSYPSDESSDDNEPSATDVRDGSLQLGSYAFVYSSPSTGETRQGRRKSKSPRRSDRAAFDGQFLSKSKSPRGGPSNLSQMLNRDSSAESLSRLTVPRAESQGRSVTPRGRRTDDRPVKTNDPTTANSSSSEDTQGTGESIQTLVLDRPETERSPLIRKGKSPSSERKSGASPARLPILGRFQSFDFVQSIKAISVVQSCKEILGYLPSTILGILLNLLDGVSYGLITFPGTPIFASFSGIGVSMFFISTIISQIVTSSRSIFAGGNGSMMIEIVPFIHNLVFQITDAVGEDRPHRVIATVMLAIASSSLLTGLTFFLLGFLKLGILLEFFPRHILVGCIGGIGAFLFITGIQVTARMDENTDFVLNMETLRFLTAKHTLPLWLIPLALSLLLRFITGRFHHPLIIPGFFVLVGGTFFLVSIPILHRNMDQLREAGWLFSLGHVDIPWYAYIQQFDFGDTDYAAWWKTMPTQLALVFFAMLHVPLNVPALALSIGEDDFKADAELLNHGISNAISGLCGAVPNYLVYTNSVLFYRVGGTGRLAGFMLAAASAVVLFIGPQIISYLPVMVVGALIYLLGMDLIKEAVIDTIGRVSRLEYLTIWIILITMTAVDFVVGIFVGIIIASISFVVIASQRPSVRRILSGTAARSTVRRHARQANFLQAVGSQIRVIKLTGFVFFGTASRAENSIRQLLEAGEWSNRPLRYLILDFALVQGVDFSAAEAFLRILRLCATRDVVLVLCGCNESTSKALRAVGLWSQRKSSRVEIFTDLNTALEHAENSLLKSLYVPSLVPPSVAEPITAIIADQLKAPSKEIDSNIASPRRSHIFEAARRTIGFSPLVLEEEDDSPRQPYQLISSSLAPFANDAKDMHTTFQAVSQYFVKMAVRGETILWSEGDHASTFYVIETGVLRATTNMLDLEHSFVETMLPGSICGCLAFLADDKRTTRLVAERDSLLWRMDQNSYERLEKELPVDVSRRLRKILMRIVEAQQDLILGHLVTSL